MSVITASSSCQANGESPDFRQVRERNCSALHPFSTGTVG
ncbi:MAG: hypothetical protein J07HB67_01525 [halophilic archaeon J07HB67]|nr:MAG: hypothetical protein J07HB67_01525 [halophilic archaeon J07HB67]